MGYSVSITILISGLCVARNPFLIVTGYSLYVNLICLFNNIFRALINIYKVQPMPAIKKVGIGLFFTLVEYVCDETQRNPPTRQFFTSCIEILGQVSLFLEYENIFKI